MGDVFHHAIHQPEGAWLAPMAGVGDVVFRRLCAEQGCVMAVTEMISAKGYLLAPPDLPAHRRLLAVTPGEAVGAQIFGCDPAVMAEAARRIADLNRFDFIDINMGCPVPKVVSHGEGSALMQNPALAARIVAAVTAAVPLPVTVKMRLGWEGNTAVDFALACEAAGAAMLCVHGRTRAQGYAGKADWHAIAEVKAAANVPVIGNGDVTCAQDALAMLAQTRCDAVMVGRAAQGNPYVFNEIACALRGEPFQPPTMRTRLEGAIRHAALMAETYGESLAVCEMRKHIGWTIKGMPGASALRERIFRQPSLAEVERLLREAMVSL